ncbi:MAG: lysophospholipid acyltransferase family protein [Bacteroidota bacterium]|nr:lysophospholipid acyltransferase family protein [Bacteroidota bacterium]
MIKAEQSSIHKWLMHKFVDYKLKQRFSNVNFYFDEKTTKLDKSILLIGNHVSWWDGFIGWHINRVVFKKQYHVMMLEDQLQKFWFFRKCGAFSINPGNKSVVKSLRYSAELLSNRDNMVQFYPQGKLHSLYEHQFEFNKGLDFILKNCPDTQVIFFAFIPEYAANEKPYISIFIEYFDTIGNNNSIQEAYHQFFSKSLQKHISMFSE